MHTSTTRVARRVRADAVWPCSVVIAILDLGEAPSVRRITVCHGAQDAVVETMAFLQVKFS